MASAPTPTPAASSGMTDNVAGALCYITIVGIVFLLIEPYNKNRFVRFHAFQSIFFCVAVIAFEIVWTILATVLAHISFGLVSIIGLLGLVVYLGILAAWIFLVFKAYSNQEFKLPVIGDLAAKQAGA